MSTHLEDDDDHKDFHTRETQESPASAVEDPTARATRVMERYQEELMAKAHVQGVAIGWIQDDDDEEGEIGIVVMVDQKVPERLLQPEDIVPEELDGVAVQVREMGFFTAQ